MVDDNTFYNSSCAYNGDSYSGSGWNELTITTNNNDTINFYFQCIQPGYEVVTSTFVNASTGSSNIYNPSLNNGVWTGTINNLGTEQVTETFHFEFYISGNDTQWTYDPYISFSPS